MNWILKFLPAEYRGLVELGIRLFGALDSASERKEVLDYAIKMFDSKGPGGGRVTGPEFLTFGRMLKIMRGPYPKNKDG